MSARLTATHRQFKSAARGTVRSSSGWDGKTLVQVFRDLRDELGYTYAEALEVTRQIRNNRLYAMVADGDGLHTSEETAFLWLLDSGVGPAEAVRRVWDQNAPECVWRAYAQAWSRLNWEHRQELEDARCAFIESEV
jgi:hypothetical protein